MNNASGYGGPFRMAAGRSIDPSEMKMSTIYWSSGIHSFSGCQSEWVCIELSVVELKPVAFVISDGPPSIHRWRTERIRQLRLITTFFYRLAASNHGLIDLCLNIRSTPFKFACATSRHEHVMQPQNE